MLKEILHHLAHKLHWNYVDLLDVNPAGDLLLKCKGCGKEYWV